MEKKWNEETVELLKDMHDLKSAGITSIVEVTNVLLSWVDEYFLKINFERSKILNYGKNSNTTIGITVLQKRLVIWVRGDLEVINIHGINNFNETIIISEFSINTYKSHENKILSRKVLFEILDEFTKGAIDNYLNERIYI